MRTWRHLWTRPVEKGKTRAEPRSQPKFYEPPWEVPEGAIEEFCSKGDFLSLPRLLKTFGQKVDHEANARQAIKRANMFSASANQVGNQPPLVYDTGASYGLTPFRSDFIDYQPCDIPVKDISKVNRVRGIGTVLYKFTATNGDLIYLPGLAYHLETADIRLFSPQTYHQLYGGSSHLDGESVLMKLMKQPHLHIRHDIEIPIDKNGSNLPMVHGVTLSSREKREVGPHFRSAIRRMDLACGFGGRWTVPVDEFEWEFGTIAQAMMPCVSVKQNQNLSQGQKELLLWHWKLGTGMQRIQELMRGHQSKDKNVKTTWTPPVIPTKFPQASSCPIPKCQTTELARGKRRNPKVVRQEAIKEKEAILAWDKYEAGDFVSMDQFVCKTPGRLLQGFGREGEANRYHGGTIFNDAATGVIWVENQVTLGAGDTLIAKETFDQWLREKAWVEIKHIHSDNGVFTADGFCTDCNNKH